MAHDNSDDMTLDEKMELWARQRPPKPTVAEFIAQYEAKLEASAVETPCLRNVGGIAYGPTFLSPVSWIALHECVCFSEDIEARVSFIEKQDMVNDDTCPYDRSFRLFGFDNTKNGILAFQTLDGLLGDEQYIRKSDGHYVPLDDNLKRELKLDAVGGVNVGDEDVLKSFIENFRQQQAKTRTTEPDWDFPSLSPFFIPPTSRSSSPLDYDDLPF